ncbi:hypothetical protein niasHT_004525 [Heterodera trifolii]|uniref:RRM domain-containing protein n=1 Tax=Heterodera trifolii TaxID=157864 RepID=A0ABD2M385_9BILA
MYRSGGGRINERDVPESQHTVFIRGLPGNMSTDEIREFFEKDFGACTFDFVKVSPDRTKLYIAVRFDSKAAARKVMENFSTDGELLGFKVEMTWFRDIRRYLAHCAKQGIRPSRFRGRSDYRRDDEQYKGRGRSRSPTRSPEREEGARSRSASAASRHSNANRRRSQSRSHSARSHSHSRSLSSGGEVRAARDGNASHSEREKSLDYSDIEEKKVRLSPPRVLSPSPPPLKKSKKEKRKKEKRQRRSKHMSPSMADHRQPHSGSDMEMGGEEEDGLSNGGGRKMLKMESSSPVNNSKMIFIGPVKPIVQQSPTAPQKLPKVELRNQSIMLDLSDPKTVSPPKFKPIGELSDYQQQINGSKGMQEFSNIRFATPPPQPSPMLRNVPLPPATNVNEMMVDRNYIAKGVSPPKFKPIGELSDYQQQINGSQEVSNIRFATPPPQPPPVLRNVPLPPVTTNNNEMMVDRTCRNNTAKPSASDFGLAGSSSSTSTGEEDDAQLFGRRVVKFLRSLNNGRRRRRACIGIEQVMIEFETEEEEEQKR